MASTSTSMSAPTRPRTRRAASSSSATDSVPVAIAHQVPSRSSGPTTPGASGFSTQWWMAVRVGQQRRQLRGAERDVHVLAAARGALVVRAERLAHDAARSVGADDVVRDDDGCLALGVLDASHVAAPRRGRPPMTRLPKRVETSGLLRDERAQRLFDDGLGDLLRRLGGEVGADEVEPEHAVEPRDVVAGDRRAEADRLPTTRPAARRVARISAAAPVRRKSSIERAEVVFARGSRVLDDHAGFDDQRRARRGSASSSAVVRPTGPPPAMSTGTACSTSSVIRFVSLQDHTGCLRRLGAGIRSATAVTTPRAGRCPRG